jgi:predicted ThiF/HesA family dinucleotide-utilizing enzyme
MVMDLVPGRSEFCGIGFHGCPVEQDLLRVHRGRPMRIIAEEQRVLNEVDRTARGDRWMQGKQLMGIDEGDFHDG